MGGDRVQNDIDPDKQRRWLLAAGVLFDQTGVLGDVIVLTAHRAVADWALTVAHVETPLGTKLALTPVVLHVGPETLDRLLSEEHPELAVVAIWAISHRHGSRAKEVVMRALEVSGRLPATLQETQRNAILSLLSERTLRWLEEMQMNPDKIPMSPAALRFKAALQAEGRREGLAEGRREGLAEGERKGLAEGERNALWMLLKTRGFAATTEERAMIEDCSDPKQLEQWIVRAVSAGSVSEVLGTNRRPRPAGPRTARPRTRQRAGR
ncbi:MAG TPA: hypothetical protein VHT91_11015 [Kofleriaceae bacterium]|nr:hypothetical protein [Kofleriaceae bacterium]